MGYLTVVEANVGREAYRQTIINLMEQGTVEVVFTKKNGDQRVLFGTLVTELIEKKLPVVGTKGIFPTVNLETVVCFDVAKEDWRSFRIDSIKTVRTLEDDEDCGCPLGSC